MRIGVNCIHIDSSYAGGINTYTLGLLRGLARVGDAHEFRIYANTRNRELFAPLTRQKNFELVVFDARSIEMRRLLGRGSFLTMLPSLTKHVHNRAYASITSKIDAECDVVYTPTNTLLAYNSRKPTVLSMHDIQHLHFPQFFSWAQRLSRTVTYELSARYANYLQASSEFIKADLLQQYALHEEQLVVIPEGVDLGVFARSTAGPGTQSSQDLPRRFLFFPAQLWPHKNHITVLRALEKLRRERDLRIPLIMTGASYSAAPSLLAFVKDNAMDDQVTYLGKVPFAELLNLYHRATFLITAVLYESSSLPVLEAAAAGTPIIASRIPPNEEMSRILKLSLFDPLDSVELARLLEDVWFNESLVKEHVKHNHENVSYYSWENVASRYLEFFRRVVN